VALDKVRELQQNLLALERLELAPSAFKGPSRRRNRPVDVLGISFGHGREQFARRRVAAFKVLAGRGVYPFAVNQHPFERTVRKRVPRQWNRLCLGHSYCLRQCQGSRYIRLNIVGIAEAHNRAAHKCDRGRHRGAEATQT
jgi:hypothetical protein